MNNNEVQFNRLSLEKGDYLVIKVDISNLTDEQSKDRLTSLREDPFVKYVEEQGNPVFITYSGINLNILRLEENDKVVASVNISNLPETIVEKYLDYVKFKLVGFIGEDKLIVLPVNNGSPVLSTIKSNEVPDAN